MIDVTNRRGYWVFTQQWGQSLTPGQLKQKRVLVRFPPENALDDARRFKEAILDAVKFMRELRPSSINAAVLHRKKELESKDKRVEVQVDLVGGHQNIILNAREEFPFSIQFNTTDPKTIRAIRDFYEKGADLSIKRGEIEFKGSPLFDELGAKQNEEVVIHHATDVEGHAVFTWGGADPESQLYVPGKFRPALKYLTFDASPPGSPLKFRTSIPWTTASTREPFSMSLAFQPKVWQHQRVVALPHFEGIYRFFNAVLSEQQVVLRLYVQGNSLGASTMDCHDLQTLKPAMVLLETLDRARALAKHFHLDPELPPFSAPITRHLDLVDELFAILFSDEYRRPAPNAKVRFKGFSSAAEDSMRATTGPITIVQKLKTYDFFGQPVPFGPVQTQFTEMRLLRQLPMKEPGGVDLELVGNGNSERIVRHKGVVYEQPQFPK